MKKTILTSLSVAVTGLFLWNSQSLAEETFEFEATAPGSYSFSVDEVSNVFVEVLEMPAQNYRPAYSIETSLQSHSEAGQFRVPPGTHEIKVTERYNRSGEGKVSVKLHISSENDATETANNDIATPREVELGEEVELAIFPRGDVDFLTLTLPEPGYLVVKALNQPNGFQLVADCANEFGDTLGNGLIRNDLDGQIMIRISDKYSDYGSLESIKILTEFYPELDHDEPNNSNDEAMKLPLGEWRQGLMAPANDLDCFRIHVPTPGYIRYETEDAPDFSTAIEIVSAETGEQVGTGNSIRVSEPGHYIARRLANYGNFSLKPFFFRFTWHNDIKITPHVAEEVTEIAPGRRYGTTIGKSGDSDRMRVSVDELSIVTFRAEGGDYLEFSRPQGGTIGNPGWIRTDQPIDVVLGARYGNWSKDTIWIEANVESEVDPTEPNDTADQAFPLNLGSFTRFHYFPRADQDWFTFEVPASGEYQVSFFAEERVGLNADMEFFDAERQSLGTRSVGATQAWSVDPIELSEGVHYLHFRSRYNSDRAIAAPLHLAVHPVGKIPPRTETTDSARNTSGVYLVGLELGGSRARLESAVVEAGGSFVAADEQGETVEKMDFVVEQIERTQTPSPERKRSWWWLLLLAAAAYGTYRWYRSRRRQKEEDSK